MTDSANSPMTPQRWIGNLLEAAAAIANKAEQEDRWLAQDAMAWERPEELINTLYDAFLFEEFIQAFVSTFNEQQRLTASELLAKMNRYNEDTPTWLDPAEVLADSRWHITRRCASEFALAFRSWPSTSLADEAAALLQSFHAAYAAKHRQAVEASKQ